MGDSNGESSSFVDFKPSYVLIAIDTHESMFVEQGDGSTPFSMALEACSTVAESLLLVQSKRNYCQFAIVFADRDEKASFLDFNSNIIDSIKTLRRKSSMSQEALKKAHLRKGVFDLASFFLFCKKKFISISSAFYQRTLVYITNDPNPVCGDTQKRFTAINEAKNFKSNNITFQLLTTKRKFTYNVFYDELSTVINAELLDQVVIDAGGLSEKLSSIIVTKISQRKLNFYPTKNDKTRYIPIIKQDLIKSSKLLNNATVSTDGKLLKKLVKGANIPSNKFSLKTHLDIVFSLEERNEIFNTDLPVGLTLVYVSKRHIDFGIVVHKSSLICVNESSSKEHAAKHCEVFNNLWQYCYDKDRVLVCARKLTYNDRIRFVELIPKYVCKRRMFLMKVIPYQDEMKGLPQEEEDSTGYITDRLQTIVQNLVDCLAFDYKTDMFCDITHAKKVSYLKSKLLDEPMEDMFDSNLEVEHMDEKIEDIGQQFKRVFGLEVDANSKKRKATSGGARAKKAK